MTDAAPLIKTGSAPAAFPKLSRPPVPPKLDTQLEQDTTLVILPDPVGYHMLVALPTIAEQTAGGIILPDTVNDRERAATVVGKVIAMGPLCYKDVRKFGTLDPETGKWTLGEPWCRVGDTVLFARYQGQRFKTSDLESGELVEYRMMADDGITGTVPEGAAVGGL